MMKKNGRMLLLLLLFEDGTAPLPHRALFLQRGLLFPVDRFELLNERCRVLLVAGQQQLLLLLLLLLLREE